MTTIDRAWIDDYIRLEFPADPDQIKVQDAVTLKYHHIPDALYRYRRFDKYSLENLNHCYEWMSHPEEFNDPFDAAMIVSAERVKREAFTDRVVERMIEAARRKDVAISQAELESVHQSDEPVATLAELVLRSDPQYCSSSQLGRLVDNMLLQEVEREFDGFCRSIQTDYLVTCFSEKKDSILMWSHYGFNHTGFCTEYDFKTLGPLHPRTISLFPVIYKDEFFDATEYAIRFMNGPSAGSLFGIYATISKSTEWSYEREWRNILPLGRELKKHEAALRLMSMPTPKKLYVGAKADPANIQTLVDIGKRYQIPVHQMTLSKERFHLEERVVYAP